MSSDAEQEALAAAWAAELGDDEGKEAGVDSAPQGADPSAEEMAAKWAEALASDEKDQMHANQEKASLRAQASEATFKDMTDVARQPRHDQPRRELDFILDIPLDVSAELGRTRLLINELLQLGQGSVVELNKLAGEPMEVYVNGKLVARGEAVVINEKFGVRLTDIISPMERVKQLG
jgi:flagellar motor switch protein FliN/FliY